MSIGNGVDGLRKHAFSAKSQFCQASGGLTGHGGGQTAQDVIGFSEMVSGGLTGHSGGQTGQQSDRPLVGGLTGDEF